MGYKRTSCASMYSTDLSRGDNMSDCREVDVAFTSNTIFTDKHCFDPSYQEYSSGYLFNFFP